MRSVVFGHPPDPYCGWGSIQSASVRRSASSRSCTVGIRTRLADLQERSRSLRKRGEASSVEKRRDAVTGAGAVFGRTAAEIHSISDKYDMNSNETLRSLVSLLLLFGESPGLVSNPWEATSQLCSAAIPRLYPICMHGQNQIHPIQAVRVNPVLLEIYERQ